MGELYKFKPEDAEEFARSQGIRTRRNGNELQFKTCPFCKSRKDIYTFAINMDTGQYNCKRAKCDAHGNMITLAKAFNYELDRITSEYYQPKRHYQAFRKPAEPIKPKEPAVAYLGERGIPAEIVQRYQVTSKQNDHDGNDIIIFTFFDQDGFPQTIKYRNPQAEKKKEWFQPNCKPILYGMDQCNLENKTLIVTEGQIDSLSVATAGIENAVSVPGGVNSFTWVSYCWDWMTNFDKIVVFGDHENGHITLYADFMGYWRNKVWCVQPEDYLDCKDANDILRKYGVDQIRKCIDNAAQPPVSNTLALEEVEDVDINSIEKLQTGIDKLDTTLKGGLPFGQVILITGKSGDGKSTLANQLIVNAIDRQFKTFIYSGELPNYLLKAWIMFQAAGPNHVRPTRSYGSDGVYEVDAAAKAKINQWLKGYAWIYDNRIATDEETEQEKLINLLEDVIQRNGIRVILLDNLMTAMDLEPDGTSFDKYDRQSTFMKKLARIATNRNVLIILVAHKRKMTSSETNDTVSGSADIVNLASVVISYERPFIPVFTENKAGAEAKQKFLQIYGVDSIEEVEAMRVLKVTKNRLTGDVTSGSGILLEFDGKSKRIHERMTESTWKYAWEFMAEAESEQLELPFGKDEGSE